MPFLKLSIRRAELIMKDWNILIFIGYTYSNPGKFVGLLRKKLITEQKKYLWTPQNYSNNHLER